MVEVFIYQYPSSKGREGEFFSPSLRPTQEALPTGSLERKKSYRDDVLTTLLAKKYGIKRAQLTRGKYGKPVIEHSPLAVSCSNTTAGFVIAISPNESIGVDLESESSFLSSDGQAQFCHPEELPMLRALAQRTSWPQARLRLWTAKESLLKVTGYGLQIDPLALVLDCQRGRLRRVPPGHEYLHHYHCQWFFSPLGMGCLALPLCAEISYGKDSRIDPVNHPLFSRIRY